MTLRRSLFVSILGTYAVFAVQLGASIILARLLSPSEMGVWTIAQAAIFISSTLRDFGAGDYLVRSGEANRRAVGQVFALMLSISLACALVLWLGRGAIAQFFREPALVGLLGLCTITYLLMPFGLGALVSLERDYSFGTLHAMQLAATLAGSATAIVLASRGFSYYSLAWGQLVQAGTLLLLRAIARPQMVFCMPVFRGWSGMFHFGVFTTLNAAIGQISAQSITAILGRKAGLWNLGLYDRAQSMGSYVSNGLTFPAMQVLYVGLARARESRQAFSALFVVSIENLTGLLWPAYGLLAILASPAIFLLYGEKWLAAAPLFSIVCCGGMFLTAYYVNVRALTALARVRRIFAIEACIMVLRLGAVVLLTPFGMKFAVAGAVLPSLVAVPFYWHAIWPHVDLRINEVLAAARRAIFISVFTVMPAAILRLFHILDTRPALQIAAALGLAGPVWLCSIYLLRHPLRNEVSRLWACRKDALGFRHKLAAAE